MLSIFSCASWPSVCLLWWNVYLCLLPIFWLGCLFFWYWAPLYILAFFIKDKVTICHLIRVPRKLSEKILLDLFSACNSLLKCNKNVSFLKQIVTGNEKCTLYTFFVQWILYNNVEQKRSWGKWNEPPLTTPKAGLHPKKVMLCIWWESSIMNTFRKAKRLIPTSTAPS